MSPSKSWLRMHVSASVQTMNELISNPTTSAHSSSYHTLNFLYNFQIFLTRLQTWLWLRNQACCIAKMPRRVVGWHVIVRIALQTQRRRTRIVDIVVLYTAVTKHQMAPIPWLAWCRLTYRLQWFQCLKVRVDTRIRATCQPRINQQCHVRTRFHPRVHPATQTILVYPLRLRPSRLACHRSRCRITPRLWWLILFTFRALRASVMSCHLVVPVTLTCQVVRPKLPRKRRTLPLVGKNADGIIVGGKIKVWVMTRVGSVMTLIQGKGGSPDP